MDMLSDIAPRIAFADEGASEPITAARPAVQSSLRNAIHCRGVGLHTGAHVTARLLPAAADTGIVFVRTDLADGPAIPARFDHVLDTRLCTQLGLAGRPEARVGTVEHVMAALAGLGVDNCRIEIDGPEMPVLDGSAMPFLFLIDAAGRESLGKAARIVDIRRTVRVEDGDAWAELRPGGATLELSLAIDFPAPAIGRQALSLTLTEASFRRELAGARTFTLASEVKALREAGLARGGSLENAIVVDGEHVLNPAGLRMPGEFVRHKMLDAVGDLALAGATLRGRFLGHRSGHRLNTQLLTRLFADPANWHTQTALALAA